MDQRKLKAIKEARYLAAENAWRYRAILNFCFEQHEKLRYFLLPREIMEHLQTLPYFDDYDEDQLQQDLNQLVEWNNLIPRQDTGKVSSIEEFKKKKFRYQCTPYTVEMERMVKRLEGISESFGGSLERTHIDRLLEILQKIFQSKKEYTPEELYSLWEELYDSYRKLNNNAADYLAHLQSEKIEGVMQTEAFLAYKDAITEYLRRFIVALQHNAPKIESILREVPNEKVEEKLITLARYTEEIPRLEGNQDLETILKDYKGRWASLREWFLGQGERESDLFYLQKATAENIRRITRYVQRLGERHHNLKSRRQEYLHLARLFAKTREIEESHCLWGVIFGPEKLARMHVPPRKTEDIYTPLQDTEPAEITVKPRTHYYRERVKPKPIIEHGKEKEEVLKKHLKELREEKRLVSELASGNRLIISSLGQVDSRVRRTLLVWMNKCLLSKNRKTQIASGQSIEIKRRSDNYITLKSEDGILTLPDYEFIIRN